MGLGVGFMGRVWRFLKGFLDFLIKSGFEVFKGCE